MAQVCVVRGWPNLGFLCWLCSVECLVMSLAVASGHLSFSVLHFPVVLMPPTQLAAGCLLSEAKSAEEPKLLSKNAGRRLFWFVQRCRQACVSKAHLFYMHLCLHACSVLIRIVMIMQGRSRSGVWRRPWPSWKPIRAARKAKRTRSKRRARKRRKTSTLSTSIKADITFVMIAFTVTSSYRRLHQAAQSACQELAS